MMLPMFEFQFDHIFNTLKDEDEFESWLSEVMPDIEGDIRQAFRITLRYRHKAPDGTLLTAREHREHERRSIMEADPQKLSRMERRYRELLIKANHNTAKLQPTKDEWTIHVERLLQQINNVETFLDRKLMNKELDVVPYDLLQENILTIDHDDLQYWADGTGESHTFELRELLREQLRRIVNRFPQWRDEVDQLIDTESLLSTDRKPTADKMNQHIDSTNSRIRRPDEIGIDLGLRGHKGIWSRISHELAEEEAAILQFLKLKRATQEELRAVWEKPREILAEINEEVGGQHKWHAASCQLLKHAISVAKRNITALHPEWEEELAVFLRERREGRTVTL